MCQSTIYPIAFYLKFIIINSHTNTRYTTYCIKFITTIFYKRIRRITICIATCNAYTEHKNKIMQHAGKKKQKQKSNKTKAKLSINNQTKMSFWYLKLMSIYLAMKLMNVKWLEMATKWAKELRCIITICKSIMHLFVQDVHGSPFYLNCLT